MAIKIPIITVFDSKGLKQAQYQLNKVRGNFQNLGRNFAIAGAAFAGAAAVITKSAQALARIESINAQTAQTIKSMGNAANISAAEVEKLAGSLEAMTAIEAEAIQQGANLLLTFGNIKNQLGAGNDIFSQTTAIMVDMGVALKKGPVDTATMLGKALNDPIRGMTALRRVGVSFTDQQVEQVKVLQQSGDLMGAQKLILAELQNQYGGSGAAFAATFAGQVELLNHELGALGEEATMVVMPALRTMVEQLRLLAPEIGVKLSAAISSVDWAAFTKAIVDTITFLVTHAETIGKVIAALFILNTAYNVGRVAVGLYKAATLITKATLEATTTSAKLLRTALFLGGVTLAVGSVIDEYRRLKEQIQKSNSELSKFTEEALAVSGAVSKLDPINIIWQKITKSILAAITANRTFRNELDTGNAGGAGGRRAAIEYGKTAAGQGVNTSSLAGILSLGGGASPKLGNGGGKVAKTASTATKAVSKLTKAQQINKKMSAVGAKMLAGLQPQIQAQAAAAQAATELARAEAEAAAERKRIYQAFADSVKNTFAGIKDSILSAFSLPSLGGSTDAIIRNMDKLLAKTKDFSANITKLSSMGLDPKLLQQVINAGPIAGAKLAANLVAGGVGGLSAINAGYAELGNVAGQIGMTGTQALFGTSAQQTVYNVTVNGGLDSKASIGAAIVDAIKAYERTSGVVFQGA